jgi:chromosome partitioning protein
MGEQSMAAKLVAVINMKGGVGKTTLSYNLSDQLVRDENKNVLLIDLDPQANATIISVDEARLKAHRDAGKKTITDLFIDSYAPRGPIQGTTKPPKLSDYVLNVFTTGSGKKFDLIASDIYLSTVLRGISVGPYDLNALIGDQAHNQYDYIIADCAPTYSWLTTIAFNTCGAVLIPMVSDTFGLYGTQLLKQIVEEHKHDFGLEIKIIGVVFMMKDKTASGTAFENEIIKSWGADKIFGSKISENKWYRVAAGKRMSLDATSAHSGAKAELDAFVKEFMTRMT